MTLISIIVALDENNAIGKGGNLLCHLPNDLKYFKQTTQGHTVIMGRKTYESLPNGALPNRRNFVLSRNQDSSIVDSEVFGSLEEALAACSGENEIFIIGGGTVYEQALPKAGRLYITRIHHVFSNADTFFPEINSEKWEKVSEKYNPADDKNKYANSFIVYKRLS